MRFSLFFLFFAVIQMSFPAHSYSKDLSRMSVEEKVGQMFLIGFNGKTISPKFKKHLHAVQPGAVIIFGRNIQSLKQIAMLNSELQKIAMNNSGVPLFIAVDQEGGSVSRIHTSPPMPSAFTIGQTNDPTLAFKAGKVTGELLSLLGFNMNLAPVLDITDSKLQSFINTRSFSDSPHKIGNMAVAFAHGLSDAHVLPVAKHYPGHGPISLDSHHTTPERHITLEELLSSDLVPFHQFASAPFGSGVMVAHIAYPKIDKSGLPATFSKNIITDILIEQLKYSGLILTDDVEMGGAAVYKRIEDRAVAAINAGNDLVMFGWNQKAQLRAKTAILKAISTGKIPMDRIDRSVQKILAQKEKLLLRQTRSMASLTNMKDGLSKIPLKQAYGDVLSHYFKNLENLHRAARENKLISLFSLSSTFRKTFNKNINQKSTKALKAKALTSLADNEILIFHVSNSSSLNILHGLPANIRKNTVVISTHPKFRMEDKSAFLEIIEIHSQNPEVGAYVASAINLARSSVSLLDY